MRAGDLPEGEAPSGFRGSLALPRDVVLCYFGAMRRWVVVAVFVALGAVGACKSAVPPGKEVDLGAQKANLDGGALGARAHFLASVPSGTIGPFWSVQKDAAVAAYVLPPDKAGRPLVTVPLDARGRAPQGAIIVDNVSVDTNSLVVRELGGQQGGFALAWTYLADRGEALSIITVGVDGKPRGPSVELARTANDVVWVEIVPTDRGALALWAEETRGGDANVFGAAVDPAGKLRGVPAKVARNVTGWQALAVQNGAAIALVQSPDPAAPREGASPPRPSLVLARLDADAGEKGPPVTVARTALSGDIELVRTGRGFLFAWTDRSEPDPQVMTATLDDFGKASPPKKVVETAGGSTLLGLASGPAGVGLAWEERRRRTLQSRRVYIARISEDGVRETRAHVADVAGRGTFELHAAARGFDFLADRRLCGPEDRGACTGPFAPVLSRLSPDAELLEDEVLKDEEGSFALAWGLRCAGDRCGLLSARGDSPARVSAIEVSAAPGTARKGPETVTALPRAPEDAPKTEAIVTLSSGDTVTDIAAIPFGEGTLLATLEGGALDDPKKPNAKAATLTTRLLDKKGAVLEKQVISTRALTVGGIALAPAEKIDDGALLSWVARENGDPEVHVTRLDKRGKRTNDAQLTTTKGDASDVALAQVPGGWLVAWVDGRNKNGEVYATKVAPDLSRIAREERITTAAGDKTDIVMLRQEGVVWIAWSDTRESPQEGFGDVYVAQVQPGDAKRPAPETRLLASAAHSRSPRLAPTANGVLAGWIEEAPMGIDKPGDAFGAMVVELDRKGQLVAAPSRVRLGGDGAAHAIALEARPSGAVAVIARASKDEVVLDAAELGVLGKTGPQAWPLLSLEGPPSMDVVVEIAQGALYFNDDGHEDKDKRTRRASVLWKP